MFTYNILIISYALNVIFVFLSVSNNRQSGRKKFKIILEGAYAFFVRNSEITHCLLREKKDMVERRWEGRALCHEPMSKGMDNSVGIDFGRQGWDGWRRAKGGNWDNCNRITIKK